jgi:hypothetical protein
VGRLPRVVAVPQPWANFRNAFSAFEFVSIREIRVKTFASPRLCVGKIRVYPCPSVVKNAFVCLVFSAVKLYQHFSHEPV